MNKLIVLLVIALTAFIPAASAAGVVADQELNNSVVFYYWDSWLNLAGIGTGTFHLTFLKHIDANEKESYWMRLDGNRRDSLLQYGKIISGKNEFVIEQVDNPAGVHYRAGIGGRTLPPNSNIHAFYILQQDMIEALGATGTDVKITIDFQNRKEIPFPISEKNKRELRRLLSIKKGDYEEFARKP